MTGTRRTAADLEALIDSIPMHADRMERGTSALIALHDDKRSNERQAAEHIIFAKDRLDIWLNIRVNNGNTSVGPGLKIRNGHTDVFDWLCANLEHALQHCPRLVAHWASEDAILSTQDFVERVGIFIDENPTVRDEERLAILRGQPCPLFPALGSSFCSALAKGPSNFIMLSPAWIGAGPSELRQQALASGWDFGMFPRMCRFHTEKPSAAHWIEHWPFAYTLMLLRYKLSEPNHPSHYANEEERNAPWRVPVHPKASPRDIVMAQAVCSHVPIKLPRCIFSFPADMPPPEVLLSKKDVEHLTSVVDASIALGLEHQLIWHLARQSFAMVPTVEMVATNACESLTLPDLDVLSP